MSRRADGIISFIPRFSFSGYFSRPTAPNHRPPRPISFRPAATKTPEPPPLGSHQVTGQAPASPAPA